MLRLTVSAEAFDEADEASAYYSAINVALGEKFDAELHALYYKIQNNPQHYSYLSKKHKSAYRYVSLHNFPFLVVFSINSGFVLIVSVFNSHRKPKNK